MSGAGRLMRLPLQDVREPLQQVLDNARATNAVLTVHWALSVFEYLKDAERWAFVRDHKLPYETSRDHEGIEQWVDERIAEKKA